MRRIKVVGAPTGSSDAEVVAWLDRQCPNGWQCLCDVGAWYALAYLNGDDDAVKSGNFGSAPEARLGLVREMIGIGAVLANSSCPFPEVGAWSWRELNNGCGWIAKTVGCTLHVAPSRTYDEFVGRVKIGGVFVVSRRRESKRGAMRAAERAARRAWRELVL